MDINSEIHNAAKFFHGALQESGMTIPSQPNPMCRLRYKNGAFDGLLFHVDSKADDTHLIRVCRHSESKNPEQEGICLKYDAKSQQVTAIAQETISRENGKMTVRGVNTNEVGAIGKEMLGALQYFRAHEDKRDRVKVEVPSTSITVRGEVSKLAAVGRAR
jgi:hypothetical protein